MKIKNEIELKSVLSHIDLPYRYESKSFKNLTAPMRFLNDNSDIKDSKRQISTVDLGSTQNKPMSKQISSVRDSFIILKADIENVL